ncbi:MAG TPA: N-acetyl-1-D-myo-inositol-2-amino-2-deoxy-alpha-D-glucopyranoside deacetylase [Streptosporangiaceae bacterium]|nr:N-acetyl-1-D-myo-inositol-2-amino-2-deoxy-alpha-D-glucopyranoside deacetylase [Streptosporangiaceae bacterium]
MNKPDVRRMLLVHAHPDDESIGTGATMAKYAAEGAQVTLVTCTLGELGEVIPPALAHLAWDSDGGLGQHRIGELAAACAALGVTDHRFLGGAGRWRDSGMMGTPSNDWPGCFWQADVDEAARALLAVITDVKPQVLVTYDANGFYGHPDHIQAHRVASRAFELADGLVSKFYATAVPKSVLAEAMAVRTQSEASESGATTLGGTDFTRVESVDELPFGTDDDKVTTRIDARDYLDAKLAAMRAHATQIAVDSPFFALSDMVGQRALGTEYYTLLAGPRRFDEPDTFESDLFAGLS